MEKGKKREKKNGKRTQSSRVLYSNNYRRGEIPRNENGRGFLAFSDRCLLPAASALPCPCCACVASALSRPRAGNPPPPGSVFPSAAGIGQLSASLSWLRCILRACDMCATRTCNAQLLGSLSPATLPVRRCSCRPISASRSPSIYFCADSLRVVDSTSGTQMRVGRV